MIKAAFFDIDGTLLSFESHLMPQSTKLALITLRERGILTIVSSGRPTYQLPPCIREGFDAYITLNGQLCLDDRGVYRSHPLADADVRSLVDLARSGACDLLVLRDDRAFVNRLSERVLTTSENVGLTYEVDDLARAFDRPVYQFCAFIEPENDALVRAAAPQSATTRWCDWFCDVVPAEGGKSYGVAATLERYGLTADEAIAFGDGENDLSMLEAVGTGVAMGNARDEVKAAADYVTDDVDSDGIFNACRHFGLL